MGNPLHRLFKKIFTGTQKKDEETVVAEVNNEEAIVPVMKDVEAISVPDKKILTIADYADEVDEYLEVEEEIGLVEREIRDYIITKVYEEKLINALETQGITKTTQISRPVVAYMLGYPGMTEDRVRKLLSQFKGYVAFNAVAQLFTKEEWYALVNTLDWRIHLTIQPMYTELKIKEVFKESAFEPLCRLAKIKGISTLGEIDTGFLVSYKHYTGVGIKKYKRTLEILAPYAQKDISLTCIGIMQESEVLDEVSPNNAICLEPHLYKLFSKYTLGQIGMIYGITIAPSVKNIKLKQIQGKKLEEVGGLINYPAVENALKQVGQIVVPSLAFEKYEDTGGLEVLKYRFEDGYSIEETASKIGQTIEITSQLQMTTLEELVEVLRTSKLVEILTYFNKGDHHVVFKVIEEVLGEQNQHIINLIRHNAFPDLGYNAIFNMVFLHEEVEEYELIATLSDELPKIFELNSYEKRIKQAIEDIGIKKWGKEVIPNLLKEMGYMTNGKIYSRGDISSSDILEMIFRDKVKKPLYLDEDAVEFLVEEAQKEYNYALGNNILGVEQKIKATQEILQVGSNVYLHSSRLKCKKELVKEIESYLMTLKMSQCKVNCNVLYNVFQNKLQGSSIQDQYGLYHIIFYYFGNQYKKETEGSLNIILKEVQEPTHRFIGLEQVKSRLQQLINNHMDRGYIKTEIFWGEIKERVELQDFLQVNQFEDYKVIAEVLKVVDDTLLGKGEFLYRTDSLYQSLEELELTQG